MFGLRSSLVRMAATLEDSKTAPCAGDGDPGDDDSLDHFTCDACEPDPAGALKALCGVDVSSSVFDPDIQAGTPSTCVVCDLLTACPRCGERFS